MEDLFDPLEEEIFTELVHTDQYDLWLNMCNLAWFGPDDLVNVRFKQDIIMTPSGLLLCTEDSSFL
jgi:hypothetical protein